jgi:predicted DNA-binding protein YlxM (UPF0122 family)
MKSTTCGRIATGGSRPGEQVVRSAEETRQRHEVEKAALLECIKKQDARITDLETRRTMLREQVEARTMLLELHEHMLRDGRGWQ